MEKLKNERKLKKKLFNQNVMPKNLQSIHILKYSKHLLRKPEIVGSDLIKKGSWFHRLIAQTKKPRPRLRVRWSGTTKLRVLIELPKVSSQNKYSGFRKYISLYKNNTARSSKYRPKGQPSTILAYSDTWSYRRRFFTYLIHEFIATCNLWRHFESNDPKTTSQ